MTPIKVFYHVTNLTGWRTIFDEQVGRIKDSGLLDNCELHINLHYDMSAFDSVKEEYKDYHNIIWHHSTGVPDDREHPTFILMQQMAVATDEEFYCLYLHQKGVSYFDGNYNNVSHWRKFLDWFNIVNWKQVVSKFDEGGWDTVGVNLQNHPPMPTRNGHRSQHYSGNSNWWTASFLRRCEPKLKLPTEVNLTNQFPYRDFGYRHDLEFYSGWNDARAFSFYNSNQDLYRYTIPESDYINVFNNNGIKMSRLMELHNHGANLYNTSNTDETYTDKGTRHTYIEFYSDNLKDLNSVKLLEIGVRAGGSIWLWKHYFPSYELWGIDIAAGYYNNRPFVPELDADPNIHILWNSSSYDPDVYDKIPNDFDVIIEDGDHSINSQVATFVCAWNNLKSGGTYIMEDIGSVDIANKLTKIIQRSTSNIKSIETFTFDLVKAYDDIIIKIVKE